MEAPPSPDYIPGHKAPHSPPGPEAPPSPDYIPGPEYPEYLPPADDVLPAEEQLLPVAVSPTTESPGYITESEPELELEEHDGDDEKCEGDSIEYPTSRGDDDADDDGDDLSEDEEESSDSEEEKEEHLASTVPALALHSFVPASRDSDETEPFKEGETVVTPPPFGYRVAARISVQPHILMPFRSESEVERLLAIPTPPLSPVSPTEYPLPTFLMPLPIFTPLPTLSFLLADKAILSGADNHPPMLEKDMYDSWKSRMELYMLNRPHGRMILESVEQGPLIWPSVEVEEVTRLKKYSELSVDEAIQADYDVKATNIILQGLPPEVYALVSTHKVAKELWERIQMLMQGTSLTKQER
nr:hypothetical protein [Tanacetum cinerariifolium]